MGLDNNSVYEDLNQSSSDMSEEKLTWSLDLLHGSKLPTNVCYLFLVGI